MRLIDGLGSTASFPELLDRGAEAEPDRAILRCRAGAGIVDTSRRELADLARRLGGGLRAAGARPGDRVAFLLGNSVDTVAFWFATGYAGVVEVPVNTELRGPVLDHVLTDSEPALVVAEPAYLEPIAACGYAGAPIVTWDASTRLSWLGSRPLPEAPARADKLAAIMYTSGTTGPSKGVMLPHGYFTNIGHFLRIVEPSIGADDVFYVCTPMFHIDARLMMSAALNLGAVLSFAPRFGASTFWPDVRDFDASFFVFVGAMVSILAKTSTDEMVRSTRLRSSVGGPTPDEAYEFFEGRHGIRLMEGYGLTECDGVVWSTPDLRRRGSVGWESGPYEVRVAGPTGDILPRGSGGEIVVRPGAPNLIAMGYWRQPEATIAAFRDLWFHTGDLGRIDADGFLWFLGRQQDVIRRRGENVSTHEVEATMSQAAGVLECAAVGVPDELGGEEEILLYVVPQGERASLAPTLFAYGADRLARFAVPRYIRFVDDLPHTPTGKVEKHRLAVSIDDQTHDRVTLAESAGGSPRPATPAAP